MSDSADVAGIDSAAEPPAGELVHEGHDQDSPPDAAPPPRQAQPPMPMGLNLSKISRATRISLSHLSRIFSANARTARTPSLAVVRSLAEYLRLSVDETLRLIDKIRRSRAAWITNPPKSKPKLGSVRKRVKRAGVNRPRRSSKIVPPHD